MANGPFELEGPVTSIVATESETIVVDMVPKTFIKTVDLTVMGIKTTVRYSATLSIPPGSPTVTKPVIVKSPTKRLTLEELANKAKLDGRTQEGFLEGTAIVEGEIVGNDYIATGVEIEPAENLLLGVLTKYDPANKEIEINNIPVKLIKDERMKGVIKNEFGFEVLLSTDLVDKPASAEGYFVPGGAKGMFYAHLIEVDSSAALANDKTAAIARVRTRERPGGPATVDFRGGVLMPDGANNVVVHLMRVKPDKFIAEPNKPNPPSEVTAHLQEIVVQANADFPKFGQWRLSGPLPVGQPDASIPPRKILAARRVNGVDEVMKGAEEETDIRFA